jgi:hypothetical protein
VRTGRSEYHQRVRRRGREALAMKASQRRWMGRVAAVRQSDIRVRDGTDGVATASRYGGDEGAEGIRRFFLERLR